MLFFPNAIIYVSDLKIIKNKEGTKIKTYDFDNPIEIMSADVQPNTLSSEQIELYGINSKNAHTKKCFIKNDDGKYMVLGNRVQVKYNSGEVEYYNIQPINIWRFHKEFLLIPVENEK